MSISEAQSLREEFEALKRAILLIARKATSIEELLRDLAEILGKS